MRITKQKKKKQGKMTPLKELSQLLSSIIESKDIEMDEM
jgi:hypothetical protein